MTFKISSLRKRITRQREILWTDTYTTGLPNGGAWLFIMIHEFAYFTPIFFQMSPEVYSPNARQQGLQKSLAERLFDLYDRDKPEGLNQSANVMFLTENYRCNKEILQFPSDNFYGEKLIARGHVTQAPHPKYSPLLFFSARGKEQKEHDNSYINLPEVCEVVKRVKEIANSWPTSVWGPKKLSEIAVLSSYRYQVRKTLITHNG